MKMVAAKVPRSTNAMAIATPTSRTSRRSISVFAGSETGKGSAASGGGASSCEMGSKDCTGLRNEFSNPIYTMESFLWKD
jgi:hypothetical protein